ncbi:MAG: NAD(P)/FAD-dependent oxidoreductase [Bacteroidetes bacterium]|nr:NAD(P)/FAD-dependent oxidoreductase [Bacteroidota bacterium]HET6244632.1 NAD(P)-binding protein [Bacteroidia bacterium]
MESGKRIVIIGSGIGGLICGAILAKEGYVITVLEMNKQIGGNLQTYARDKHVFDSGVHYIGGLEKGQNLFKIFKYLDIMDKLRMEKLDENAFDKIVFGSDNKEYKYAQGYDTFSKSLIADFPEEEQAIEKYCQTIRDICDKFPLYNLRQGDFMEKSIYLEIDTKTFICSITNNTRLQNVLGGNNPLYAGIGDKTPLYVHALVLNSYIESSYRLINGGSQIAKLLTRIILANGGSVKNKTEIKKLSVDNHGLVEYAEAADGSRYEADHFISNIHPAKTLSLTDSEVIRMAYRNRINNLENSISAFILNVTLKPNMFKYVNTNYYCYLEDDVWECSSHTDDSWPLFYAMFYSGMPKDTQYAEGITIMGYMKFEEVEKWKDTFNTVGYPNSRGEEYEAFKKRKAEKLLDVVEQKFPGLKNAIKNYYTSTPLTFRDYMGTDDGSIYGIAKDYKEPLKTFISPRTKIKNLLLTGQNINLHGILGVSISSLVTCSVLLGMDEIIKKVDDAQID